MKTKSVRQQFADTMLHVGQEDSNLAVLIGDISHFILQPFAEACPGRFYNVGICEPTMVSMAAGLSKLGFHPVVHTIAPFIVERSFEQIKLDFCYHSLSGNLVTLGSVFDYSNLGCTHHCYGDFALLKTLPGAEIAYPSSALEFDELFRQSYRNSSLTLFRIPAHQHGLEFEPKSICFGEGMKLCDGDDLTIVVTGPQLGNALAAKDALSGENWSIEILYIHTIRPLDSELIQNSVSKTGRVLVVEEHMQNGGLNEDVLRIANDIGSVEFANLCIPNTFVRGYGSYNDHCSSLGLTSSGIQSIIRKSFNKKRCVVKATT